MQGSAISHQPSGCHCSPPSEAAQQCSSPPRDFANRYSRSSWRLILALPGHFTIDTACHQTGMSWRNAQAVIARLRRQGRIQIVGSERRRKGHRAPVYRVVPAADRARLRRRARPIQPSAPSVPSDLSEVLT